MTSSCNTQFTALEGNPLRSCCYKPVDDAHRHIDTSPAAALVSLRDQYRPPADPAGSQFRALFDFRALDPASPGARK